MDQLRHFGIKNEFIRKDTKTYNKEKKQKYYDTCIRCGKKYLVNPDIDEHPNEMCSNCDDYGR